MECFCGKCFSPSRLPSLMRLLASPRLCVKKCFRPPSLSSLCSLAAILRSAHPGPQSLVGPHPLHPVNPVQKSSSVRAIVEAVRL